MTRLQTGDLAPDFVLPDAAGHDFRLYESLLQGPGVLYFYPKDETLGCTAQACAFRDRWEGFRAAGAWIAGVSHDSAAAHEQFIRNQNLPFTLLTDASGEVHARYGVGTQFWGMLRERITFVIGQDQRIHFVYDSAVWMGAHAAKALEVVQGLQTKTPGS